MNKEKYLIEKINILDLAEKIITKLEKNSLYFVEDIWKLRRVDLKNMNFSNEEINKIIIQLQLKGLDVNKKIY